MELIADLHLHSKYSRAVSRQMVIPEIARWAAKKGIGLVGTADWTHPLWLRELKENLEEKKEGIYQIKNEKLKIGDVCFILSTEISSIYTQGGKVRRIHNLLIAPSFEVVDKINEKLRNSGVNLFADGRPMTGLTSIELCELVFSVSQNCLIIPAHVWTPWFSLYGSRSGFDSIKECFGEYVSQIYAVETGLSSDPAMNWRIAELDSRTILSFSDAHSPAKMSREATVFKIEDIEKLEYEDIKEAVTNNKIAYTIEFYPEEGKYHWTGHRNCKVKHSPQQTKKLGETCPVCGRLLTVGVVHRVEELATRKEEEVKTTEVVIDRAKGVGWQKRPPYVMLVPLMEILAESLGSGFTSKSVLGEYDKLTAALGSEFNVLLQAAIEDIAKISGGKVAEGIKKVRERDIVIDPGSDGVFGKVKIWPDGLTAETPQAQMSLF